MPTPENAHARLPINLETLGALLAQPGYEDEAARQGLLQQPEQVVRKLLQGLGDSVAEETGNASFRKLGALNTEPLLEVHENSPDTWNIIIPSQEMLEMEANNPWVAGAESLSDELLDQVSAGEAITLSVVGAIAGSFVIGKITINVLAPLVVAAVTAAVGTAVLGGVTATAIGLSVKD